MFNSQFTCLNEKEMTLVNGGAVAGAVFGAVFGFGIGLCVSTTTCVISSKITGNDIKPASIFAGAAVYALKGAVAGAFMPI
jgi:uncharacterized protein YcfJ